MNLSLDIKLADNYTSLSQKIRVLTEDWVNNSVYCPNCAQLDIEKYANNKPVADFFCSKCKEDYELKSKKESIGDKIVNGTYLTMIERLQKSNNPNFFLLNYDLRNFEVMNFFVIPKHFFIPEIIEKRKPLSETAHRAGWVGCNILLQNIPQSGRIFYVKNHQIKPKEEVLSGWEKTLFLREEREISTTVWLLDIMNCVDKIDKHEFTLEDIYSFKNQLSKLHPDTKHIKDKIRQQLQVLRDKGYLDFISKGTYKIT